jgi:hypothetical protein
MKFSRRHFLGSLSLAAGSAQLPSVLFTKEVLAAQLSGQRAVFQQQSYQDYSGQGDIYNPPVANRSTRLYVRALSDEEFLRRHWFH